MSYVDKEIQDIMKKILSNNKKSYNFCIKNECVNLIDCIMSCNIEKHDGIEKFEDVRNYVIQTTDDNCSENIMVMLDTLCEINLILKKFHVDIKPECETLRNVLLIWLEELYTNPITKIKYL